MSDNIYINLAELNEASLTLEPINKGDKDLYFEVNTNDHTLSPNEELGFLIVPHSYSPTDEEITTKINNRSFNYTNGYFTGNFKNNTDANMNLSPFDVKISSEGHKWENTKFDLYWRQYLGNSSESGSYTSGIYSFPHNIQTDEITVSGNILENQDKMEYRVYWNGINNEDSDDYDAAPDDGPYKFKAMVTHRGGEAPAEGFEDGYIYYESETMDTGGIVFQLPLYTSKYNTNAVYNFHMSNVVASGDKDGCTPLVLNIDHNKLINTNGDYYKDLDKVASESTNKEKFKKEDEILIKKNIIDRNRLSVQINDIGIKSNKYKKQGIYISKPYILDYNIYTFSLKVNENIPEYENINKYDVIKYYIEFNSNKWERVSPINRNLEKENNNTIPKMFIFDDFDDTETIKSLKYNSNINEFRIKIAFDVKDIPGESFPPPEVHDYKCIIFDKKSLLNI